MSKKANPTLIGLFVIGAAVLVVAAVVVFGSGAFFKDTLPAVSYFEGSVRGLKVGATVLFRGVPIGQVVDLRAVVDTGTRELHIPVVYEIDPALITFVGGARAPGRSPQEIFAPLIDQGLRSQLVMESLVTGQLAVELDYHPETPATLRAPEGSTEAEIPSIPTDLQEVRATLENLIASIQEVPIEDLVATASRFLSDLDELVKSEEVGSIVAGLNRLVNSDDTQTLARSLKASLESLEATAEEARELIRHADQKVDPLLEKLDDVIVQVNTTMAETRELLASARYLTGEDSELLARANGSLRELESAMRSLRVLLDYLERNPQALLRGKGKGKE